MTRVPHAGVWPLALQGELRSTGGKEVSTVCSAVYCPTLTVAFSFRRMKEIDC